MKHALKFKYEPSYIKVKETSLGKPHTSWSVWTWSVTRTSILVVSACLPGKFLQQPIDNDSSLLVTGSWSIPRAMLYNHVLKLNRIVYKSQECLNCTWHKIQTYYTG